MFNKLREIMEEKVPEAFKAKENYKTWLYYFYSTGYDEARKKFDGAYARITLRMTYPELSACSLDEFLTLQELFYVLMLQNSQEKDVPLTAMALKMITPGAKGNVLLHERQHLDPLPPTIQKYSFADVSIYLDRKYPGKMTTSGSAYYDSFAAHPWGIAIAASNPDVLSDDDRRIALSRAEQTGDKKFLEEIRRRVEIRPQFED